MELLIIAVLIGLIPAAIARSKGHSFGTWWLFGALLFIVALPMALLLKPNKTAIEQAKITDEDMKKCPYCAELIKREANVCRYCGREMKRTSTAPASAPWRDPVEEWDKKQKLQHTPRRTAPMPPAATAPCPHCETTIDLTGLKPGKYTCPNCKGHIEIE